MATASTTNTTSTPDDIRRQMAQIRMALHQDVQGLVAGTEAASDWKYYVRHYPWAAIGAAVAVGFLIVPRKRRSVTATAHKAAEAAVQKVVDQAAAGSNGIGKAEAIAPKAETKRKAGLFGLALGFAGPIVMRVAQSYVTTHLESFLAQQGMLDPDLLGKGTDPAATATSASGSAAAAGAPPRGTNPPRPR